MEDNDLSILDLSISADDLYEIGAEDKDYKAYQKIWAETAWPHENAIRDVKQSIGKEIKFANQDFGYGHNKVVLILFTDNTFIMLKAYDLTTSVELQLSSEEHIQELLLQAGLTTQEKVDKLNKFNQDRADDCVRKSELDELDRLMSKYPEAVPSRY